MQLHGPQESSYQNPGFSPAVPEKTTYGDSSGAIFSMYISRAKKFDEENAENWKGGAEGILVFVRWLLNHQDGSLLTRSLPSDRSFRIYGGHFHFHKLSESTARPQCHHPIPPYPNISTTSWILKCYHKQRKSINQSPRTLQPPRCRRVRELGLVCQPRVESHVCTHGYHVALVASPVSSTYSTELSTPCPRTHARVLCMRREQVPHLDACRSTARPPSHLCPPLLFRTRCICIPRQYHRRIHHRCHRSTLCSLVHHPDFSAAQISRLPLLDALFNSALVLRTSDPTFHLLSCPTSGEFSLQ
jgi:hypothetical protein